MKYLTEKYACYVTFNGNEIAYFQFISAFYASIYFFVIIRMKKMPFKYLNLIVYTQLIRNNKNQIGTFY